MGSNLHVAGSKMVESTCRVPRWCDRRAARSNAQRVRLRDGLRLYKRPTRRETRATDVSFFVDVVSVTNFVYSFIPGFGGSRVSSGLSLCVHAAWVSVGARLLT